MWRRPLAHAALRCADRALAASGGLAAALHIDLRSHVQHISFRFVSPRLFGLWWFGIIAVTLKAVFSDIWGLPRVSTCLTLVSADW